MFDGIRKSASIWKEAKKADKARPKVKRSRSEYEFLPAVIEVMETPASPVGRAVMLSIGAFLMIAALWAWFGKIDVVSTANGKVVPTDHVKYIQSSEIGVVRAIHVKDGQDVKAGDVLIELDPTDSEADRDRLLQERLTAELEQTRLEAMVADPENVLKSFHPPKEADPARVRLQFKRIENEVSEYNARMRYYREEGARRQAQRKIAFAKIDRLQSSIPFIVQQVEAIAELERKGYAGRLRLLELQQVQVESEKDLLTERAGIAEINASIAALKEERTREENEIRKNNLTELNEIQRQIDAIDQELLKAERRDVLRRLTAPVDGKIQQLAIHTIGGVVEAAKPLMVIVPADSHLVVDVKILNKDIGFVKADQEAEIKLEAFPYTKYGVIEGKVLTISNDAVEDEKLGLVYNARIEMHSTQIQVDNRLVNIAAGMAATVEVKTGNRRVLEYVLTPLLKYKSESLKER